MKGKTGNCMDCEKCDTDNKCPDVSDSELIDLLRFSLEEIVWAATEYVKYEHDGDPWSEDARAMGELTLNDMARDGRLQKYRELISMAKGLT